MALAHIFTMYVKKRPSLSQSLSILELENFMLISGQLRMHLQQSRHLQRLQL